MSRVGSVWTLHCIARGKLGHEFAGSWEPVTPYARRVNEYLWSKQKTKIGLPASPELDKPKNMTAHPVGMKASAEVEMKTRNDEAPYALSPQQLDSCFGVMEVAAFKGLSRLLEKVSLPVSIGQISVRPPFSSLQVQATARLLENQGVVGDIVAFDETEEVVLEMQEFTWARTRMMESEQPTTSSGNLVPRH
ncbi:hypothetical protein HIM_05847 [Hirsutella minnesotensis 3608]|uniref:Polyketide synthase dehydratase domain-containing protein n=1 Tax=Hirsutella minnesotensis 3608 TaxID=1043627 RepID=A0A0F7ZP19_9HYPO|nr:hypothetical protein HIM_05847 [Hirsutella minnesotensis 3608]